MQFESNAQAGTATAVQPGILRSQVSLFGEDEPAERETRVEVPVRLCLTFAEMLGLLTFTTGMCVTDDDLDVNRHGEPCDVFLYEALVYALVQNDADAIEWNAERAMLAYIGHGRPSDPPVSYLRRLGAEITRVFGVAPNAAVVGVAR